MTPQERAQQDMEQLNALVSEVAPHPIEFRANDTKVTVSTRRCGPAVGLCAECSAVVRRATSLIGRDHSKRIDELTQPMAAP
ncbi:MAG: hypothetical protein AAGA99_26545 [Actinomycetota bacterium]